MSRRIALKQQAVSSHLLARVGVRRRRPKTARRQRDMRKPRGARDAASPQSLALAGSLPRVPTRSVRPTGPAPWMAAPARRINYWATGRTLHQARERVGSRLGAHSSDGPSQGAARHVPRTGPPDPGGGNPGRRARRAWTRGTSRKATHAPHLETAINKASRKNIRALQFLVWGRGGGKESDWWEWEGGRRGQAR